MQQRRQINKRFLGQSRGFSALFFGYKLYVLCTSSLSLYCTFLFVQRRPPFPLMLCRLSHPQISRREKKEGKIFTEGRATSTRRTFLLGGQGEKRFTTFNETRFFWHYKGDRSHGQIPAMQPPPPLLGTTVGDLFLGRRGPSSSSSFSSSLTLSLQRGFSSCQWGVHTRRGGRVFRWKGSPKGKKKCLSQHKKGNEQISDVLMRTSTSF